MVNAQAKLKLFPKLNLIFYGRIVISTKFNYIDGKMEGKRVQYCEKWGLAPNAGP
jgi:hypothetical protein